MALSIGALAARALADGSPPTDQTWVDEPMSKWLETVTGTTLTDCNKVEVYHDGEYFKKRLELINSTKKGDTIDIETFLWCDDAAGLPVAKALADAAKRGVRVRAIVDFMNAHYSEKDEVYSTLRSAGIPLIEFNPPYWGLNQVNDMRLHEKQMIINGHTSLVGGANLCDEYQTGVKKKLWHDAEMRIDGPEVAQQQADFDTFFNKASDDDFRQRQGIDSVCIDPDRMPATVFRKIPHYSLPTPVSTKCEGNAKVLFMHQSHYLKPGSGDRYQRIFGALYARAHKRLVVYSPYVVFPEEFRKELIEKARSIDPVTHQRVEVIVMTNSIVTNDNGKQVALAQVNHYPEMMDAGIEIYEINDTTQHLKGALIDDDVLEIGSHNKDNRSFLDQNETSFLTGDQTAIKKFKTEVVEPDLKRYHHVTRADVAKATATFGDKLNAAMGGMLEFLY